MTKAAAIDLAQHGIAVNSVHPGPIDNEMLKIRTPEENPRRLELVPMKRMGSVAEPVPLDSFLARQAQCCAPGRDRLTAIFVTM